MNKAAKIVIVIVLVVAVVVVIAVKERSRGASGRSADENASATTGVPQGAVSKQEVSEKAALPRLVDLGAGKCIPCKMMMPILEDLRKEYQDRLEVTVIDITKDTKAADYYDIRVIPTQLFFDASGKELFRHEGFFSKEDILAKWAELGIDLTETR